MIEGLIGITSALFVIMMARGAWAYVAGLMFFAAAMYQTLAYWTIIVVVLALGVEMIRFLVRWLRYQYGSVIGRPLHFQ